MRATGSKATWDGLPARPGRAGSPSHASRGTTLGATAITGILALAWSLIPAFSFAQAVKNQPPPIMEKVAFEQNLDAQLPLDQVFVDEDGKQVRLGDYFGERPVILSLVYYECPMLCTLVLNGLVDALNELPFAPGEQIEILTVSFDPGETPDLAMAKKENYVEQYAQEGASVGWHFLTGSEEAIAQLTSAVGFKYAYDEETDQFAHASGIVVATPKGKVSRYLFGVEYPPRDLRLSVVEASQHRIGSVVDRLMLFCYHYDPVTGKYSAAVMNFVRLGCFAVIFALAGFLFTMFRREFRKGRKLPQAKKTVDV